MLYMDHDYEKLLTIRDKKEVIYSVFQYFSFTASLHGTINSQTAVSGEKKSAIKYVS